MSRLTHSHIRNAGFVSDVYGHYRKGDMRISTIEDEDRFDVFIGCLNGGERSVMKTVEDLQGFISKSGTDTPGQDYYDLPLGNRLI